MASEALPEPQLPQSVGHVLDAMAEAFAALDADARYVYVNQRAADMLGRTPEDLIGRHIWTEFPEGVGQPFHLAYERAMVTRTEISFEDYYEPWDRWFENRVFPTDDGILILFTETTDARRARAALERNERRFRSLLAATAATAWWTDATGAVVESIPQWEAFTGQTADEARGWGWLAAIHPDDRERTSAAWREALLARRPYAIEHQLRRRDGSWRTMAARGVPLLGADGAVREWVGAHVDLTDERAAQAALAASETRFRSLSTSSPIGIYEADVDGRVTYVNPRATEIWGASESELLGYGWTARVHPDDRPALLPAWWEALAAGADGEREYRLLPPTGGCAGCAGGPRRCTTPAGRWSGRSARSRT